MSETTPPTVRGVWVSSPLTNRVDAAPTRLPFLNHSTS